jgi:hypothetical protein
MQAEIQPQKEMPIGGTNGFMPYSATASMMALACSEPPTMDELNGVFGRMFCRPSSALI